jgi:hypothetical protein
MGHRGDFSSRFDIGEADNVDQHFDRQARKYEGAARQVLQEVRPENEVEPGPAYSKWRSYHGRIFLLIINQKIVIGRFQGALDDTWRWPAF